VRFVVGRGVLGQVCGGQRGTGIGLWWVEGYWDRFVMGRGILGQVCGEQRGIGTGFSASTSIFFCQYHSTIGLYSFSSTCCT
jgi:hypothetical protein